MKLPRIPRLETVHTAYTSFGGLNNPYEARENELLFSQNASSRKAPFLSVREKRTHITTLTAPQGMIAHDDLFWIDGGIISYGGIPIEHDPLSPGQKTLARIGSKVVIFPDKKLFDTVTLEVEDMENTVTVQNVSISLAMDPGGTAVSPVISSTAPEDAADGTLWLDTSNVPHALMKWSASAGLWAPVAQTYVKFAATGIGSGFSPMDGVTITGTDGIDGDYVLEDCSENHLLITALIDETTLADSVTVSRTVPDLDFLCTLNNRLWGCSSERREIRASKLGDPKNWNCFSGLASDSYAMTVGSPGPFTGCTDHLGSALFFKEDRMLRIFGTRPSNFQLSEFVCAGTARGSEKSIASVNETLFYLSAHGPMATDGGIPAAFSRALEDHVLSGGVGAALDGKYYLSCRDEAGDPHLFVYDAGRYLWEREDATCAVSLAACGGHLFCLTDEGDLWCTGESPYAFPDTAMEEQVPFSWQTGWFGRSEPYYQRMYRVALRLKLAVGAHATVAVRYGEKEPFSIVAQIGAGIARLVTVPFTPRRAPEMQLLFTGAGDVDLIALSLLKEKGTEWEGPQ